MNYLECIATIGYNCHIVVLRLSTLELSNPYVISQILSRLFKILWKFNDIKIYFIIVIIFYYYIFYFYKGKCIAMAKNNLNEFSSCNSQIAIMRTTGWMDISLLIGYLPHK